jgi:formamidopyrimidine-DNA glycosylase
MMKKSLKAFLATEQRIPGLGNGVLQDILLNAELHPKRKVQTLEIDEVRKLYESVVETLGKMTDQGMRNTEKDIFGNKGGYQMMLSKDTYKSPCVKCGGQIIKKAYMGGSIYYCDSCQPEG